jgi:hypothetical protein
VVQWIEHQVPVLRSGGSSPSVPIDQKAADILCLLLFSGELATKRYRVEHLTYYEHRDREDRRSRRCARRR